MKTRDIIEAKLTEYFYNYEMFVLTNDKIEDIQYLYSGVHAVNNDKVKGNAQPRDSRLVSMSIKTTPLEKQSEKYRKTFEDIAQSLHLSEIDEIEFALLQYIYRYKKTYDEIANIIGYADKTVVFRKRDKLLDKLVNYYERN